MTTNDPTAWQLAAERLRTCLADARELLSEDGWLLYLDFLVALTAREQGRRLRRDLEDLGVG
jgi:hypothetical protein